MRPIVDLVALAVLLFTAFGVLVVPATVVEAQDSQGREWQIRVEPLDQSGQGLWIRVPGYLSVGSTCLSPDGEWIAFDCNLQGLSRSPAEVKVVRRDGTGMQTVTNGATPRWSPDGDHLVFMRDDPPDNSDGQRAVFVARRDGSDEHRLFEGRWPDWSPDGRRVVFSRDGQGRFGGRAAAEIYIANADGSDVERVCTGDCPSWSPDGKSVACLLQEERDGPAFTQIVNLESREIVTVGPGWLRANWSPDSTSLVVNGGAPRELTHMVRYPAEAGAEPVRLFQNIQGSYAPNISSDGKVLVFVVLRSDL